MADSPLISVIVPVYNVEPYLRRCLDSICGQTYRNLEILCVNDGSTDGSASILEEFAAKDSRIKVFTQANAGQGAARNLALQHATGEWITGVDSDDYLEPDAYEYALSGVRDDIDIICFGTKVDWEDRAPEPHLTVFYKIEGNSERPPDAALVSGINDSFCNKLTRAKLIQKVGFNFPVGLWYEDSFFWRAVAPFAERIKLQSAEKYHYVRRNNSTMSQVFSKSDKTLDRISIAARLMEFYDTHPLPQHLQQVKIDAFLFCFNCALSDVPKALHSKVWSTMRSLALKHNLFNQYPHQLKFLKPVPLLLRPFIKHHGPGKSSYGIPGFRPLVVQRKNGMKITRILGIKLHRISC
ncbi:MAG: glycosyltransferase family A protein [bacterium]|nr:glycosyltransferase family A protein [bacterium]